MCMEPKLDVEPLSPRLEVPAEGRGAFHRGPRVAQGRDLPQRSTGAQAIFEAFGSKRASK